MFGHARSMAIGLIALAFVGLGSPAAAQTGLVAAYGFNEGAGATAADATGNAHTGTLNGASWTTSGRFGSALTFNGTSNTVTIADSALLDLTSAMTIEAWVYATSSSGWRTVLLKESSSGLSYALYGSEGGSRPSGWIRRTSDVGITSSST